MFHRCYVDEVLALLSSLDHADKFEKYFSSKYPNINLFKEKGKKNGCLPFLDVSNFS